MGLVLVLFALCNSQTSIQCKQTASYETFVFFTPILYLDINDCNRPKDAKQHACSGPLDNTNSSFLLDHENLKPGSVRLLLQESHAKACP